MVLMNSFWGFSIPYSHFHSHSLVESVFCFCWSKPLYTTKIKITPSFAVRMSVCLSEREEVSYHKEKESY